MGELADFINILADASGDVINKYYRNFGSIEQKDDKSPVTIADTEAEAVIINLIREKYPDDGINAEESGIYNKDAKRVWYIDPIDGTASFMIGRPIFGTLIALTENNQPLISVIDQAVTGERWMAIKNDGCSFNGRKISSSDKKSLNDAVICTTSPYYLPGVYGRQFSTVADKSAHIVYGGDCYNYALLASGMVDIVMETDLKPHDYMALQAVVEESGGVFTNWQGGAVELDKGQVLACASKELHHEVIQILQKNL